MSLKWTVSIRCDGCDAEVIQGPLVLGPRDEEKVGHPPDGWSRFEMLTNEKVLPMAFDETVKQLEGLPADLRSAQIEALEMICPMLNILLDFCPDCMADPRTPGKLFALIEAEKVRLLEVADEEFEEQVHNVIVPLFGKPPHPSADETEH